MIDRSCRLDNKQRREGEQQMDRLKLYVIEELAIFLYAYCSAYETELYVGNDLSIMQKIRDKQYPDFPFDCPKRTHVSLDINKTT